MAYLATGCGLLCIFGFGFLIGHHTGFRDGAERVYRLHEEWRNKDD